MLHIYPRSIKLIIVFIFLLTFKSYSQQIISPNGNYFKNSSLSISYTIGEPLINTYYRQDLTLLQGFQQTDFLITEINKPTNVEMDLYPNPTKGKVTLKINNPRKFNYSLYNLKGQLLVNSIIVNELTEISFDGLPPAFYILKIHDEVQELKSYQILKLQ